MLMHRGRARTVDSSVPTPSDVEESIQTGFA